ncbi:MAG: hypothetical protein H6555_10675 [Lewinellaceae bacterium]|nr:hypothetical protein [Lewinellaceae bacterium]
MSKNLEKYYRIPGLSCGILLIVLISLSTLSAQPEENVFAYVRNANSSPLRGGVPGYKLATLSQVYQALIQARGDMVHVPPKLIMRKADQYVAWMDAKEQVIGVEEKAYDLCVSLGADSLRAMAALLGHELTHFYEKHDWNTRFAADNQELGSSQIIQNLSAGLSQETQADYLGGFLALSAGYDTYGILPRLLPAIYAAYELPDSLVSYPPLQERVQLAELADERRQALTTVFDLANNLHLIGAYQDAGIYYQYLVQQFPSREMFNNAGVNYVQAALLLFNPADFPYLFPLETDLDSRLKVLQRAGIDQRVSRRDSLLALASDCFNRALMLDNDYWPAKLNQAVLEVLRDDVEAAAFHTSRLRRNRPMEQQAQADVLLGVIAALAKDTTEALEYWSAAQKQGNVLATLNLQRIQGSAQASLTGTMNNLTAPKIENYSLGEYLRNPQIDRQVEVNATSLGASWQKGRSTIYIHYADEGKRYGVFQVTADANACVLNNPCLVGKSLESLEKQYGPPGRLVATPQGSVAVYPALKAMWIADQQGVIKQYCVFSTEKLK